MTSRTYSTIMDALTTATSEAAVDAVLARYAPAYRDDRRWEDVAETAVMQIEAVRVHEHGRAPATAPRPAASRTD